VQSSIHAAPVTSQRRCGFTPTNLTFGTGYIRGGWPDESNNEFDGNDGKLLYLNGDIAAITLS